MEHNVVWGGRRAPDGRGIPRGPAEGNPVALIVRWWRAVKSSFWQAQISRPWRLLAGFVDN